MGNWEMKYFTLPSTSLLGFLPQVIAMLHTARVMRRMVFLLIVDPHMDQWLALLWFLGKKKKDLQHLL